MAVRRFSYDGDPSTSAVNGVRYLTGDTDQETAEIDDKEIEAALSSSGDNARLAAVELLVMLANKYGKRASVTVGQVSKQLSGVSDTLRKRADELRDDAIRNDALPFFGGLTHTGKADLDERSDDVQPRFTRGQFDNPEASQLDGPNGDEE
jgi:hypothetical protein